jgi:hypothetical protein
MRALSLALPIALALAACTASDPADDLDGATELDPGGPVGKEDSAGVPGLPVTGDYAATAGWTVTNQWEDTTTAAARQPGMAWGADSGLTWDQKFSAWVGSFEQIPSMDWFLTIKVSTPFGKAVPGPKIDCADFAIMLRMSFAAWYHLPIQLVGYDGNTRVYFGHFGVRTATGKWSQASSFGAYADYSSTKPADYAKAWPSDKVLRTRGIAAGDEIPFLGAGARLGAFLDEIHLNKRAARLIMFTQAYLGSHNMVDSQNTYNLVPASVRTGDVLMFARSPRVDGHTTLVSRVTPTAPGRLQLESVYGNDPPAQPAWQSPASTRSLFTDDEGGGPTLNTPYGGTILYSHLNGGLKRFRVAKAKNGRWVNTWMNADEASWINDTNYDAIGARPAQFAELLGDPDPNVQRDQLLSVIEQKRTYLENHPSSCAARADRETAFTQLYGVMSDNFGQDRATVDNQYRVVDDYVFAPLDYSKSPTCCWNHSTQAMYQQAIAYVASFAASAGACVEPPVFKMTAKDYDPFKTYALAHGALWGAWSADEDCAQAAATDDVVMPVAGLLPYCQLSK